MGTVSLGGESAPQPPCVATSGGRLSIPCLGGPASPCLPQPTAGRSLQPGSSPGSEPGWLETVGSEKDQRVARDPRKWLCHLNPIIYYVARTSPSPPSVSPAVQCRDGLRLAPPPPGYQCEPEKGLSLRLSQPQAPPQQSVPAISTPTERLLQISRYNLPESYFEYCFD